MALVETPGLHENREFQLNLESGKGKNCEKAEILKSHCSIPVQGLTKQLLSSKLMKWGEDMFNEVIFKTIKRINNKIDLHLKYI